MRTDLMYYKKNGSLSSILNHTHQEMQKFLTVGADKEQAQEIQQLLKIIKLHAEKISRRTDSATIDTVNDQILKLINNVFEQQKKVHSKKFSESSYEGALFRRSHSTKSIVGTDDIFEEELAYILQAAARSKGINANLSMFIGGQKSASTAAINQLSKEINNKMKNITVEAALNYKTSLQRASSIGGLTSVRAGKIDIDARSLDISIIGQTDDLISKLLKAFSGKTFSLKNYSSYGGKDSQGKIINKNANDIVFHMGDSNMYKGITGSLSTVFPDVEIQNTIYFRGMNYLRKITNPPDSSDYNTVQQHFAHLRFIYEVRGQGLLDQNGNPQIADFIIWNDPASTNIAVRSTKWLIQEAAKKYTNPFAKVGLSASYFV